MITRNSTEKHHAALLAAFREELKAFSEGHLTEAIESVLEPWSRTIIQEICLDVRDMMQLQPRTPGKSTPKENSQARPNVNVGGTGGRRISTNRAVRALASEPDMTAKGSVGSGAWNDDDANGRMVRFLASGEDASITEEGSEMSKDDASEQTPTASIPFGGRYVKINCRRDSALEDRWKRKRKLKQKEGGAAKAVGSKKEESPVNSESASSAAPSARQLFLTPGKNEQEQHAGEQTAQATAEQPSAASAKAASPASIPATEWTRSATPFSCVPSLEKGPRMDGTAIIASVPPDIDPYELMTEREESHPLLSEDGPIAKEADEQPCPEREGDGNDSVGSGTQQPTWVQNMVNSLAWERVVSSMLFANSLVLGVETDYQASIAGGGVHDSESVMRFLDVVETIFCIIFTVEVAMRLVVFQWRFFQGAWNVFDFVLVGIQVMERASLALPALLAMPMDTSFVRILRILRLIRITRVIRMIRLVEELRTIVRSIASSMISLAWTMLLLLMLLYMVSVFFTQVVLEAGTDTDHAEQLEYWYGRLGRTYLTMFECIFSGVSWDEAVVPLMRDISPWLGLIYMCYVAFCSLVLMNMATGVFVDNAMRKAQEDKDTNTANHISDLFFEDDGDGVDPGTITYERFCSKIDTPDMQEYFRAINVDPSEAKGLYRLLDADGSGSVDAEEMVSGCLRLRGNAKALELQLLMYETNSMYEKFKAHQGRVERCLSWVVQVLEEQSLRLYASPGQGVVPRRSLMRGLSYAGFSSKMEARMSEPSEEEGVDGNGLPVRISQGLSDEGTQGQIWRHSTISSMAEARSSRMSRPSDGMVDSRISLRASYRRRGTDDLM